MAKDVSLRIGASVERAEQEIRKLQATGQQVTSVLEQSFSQLGTKSTMSVEAQKQAYVAAYERIKDSGVASWQEIQTAHAAMTAKISALDASLKPQGLKSLSQNVEDMGTSIDKLTPRFVGLAATLAVFYAGSKLWEGFKAGIEAVDSFQQSVTKTAAMITSLQGGSDLAGNYQKAKQYAEGLTDALMQVDSRTNLNLESLQSITEEMVKQGIVFDYNNKDQVEGFTRLANAVAVYSRNGADEKQLRQEVSALLRGQVDQNSQLASMIQRTVSGPLKDQVEKWKESGVLVEELGKRLGGFGPAADDLATSWSAVKSSLETSVMLVLRAGFTEVVKDVAGWLGKINEYLKSHREEIGEKIRGAWETAKELMKDAAAIAKAVYNNFEPFAALFIGGALIGGLTKAVGLFITMRDLAISTRAAMVGIGMLGAGGAAGTAAAGGVAAAGIAGAGGLFAGSAAAGAGILGSTISGAALGGAVLPALPLGLGLGYALQPLVRMADRSLYKNFGVNLTGEAMYNQEQQKSADADARWQFFQTEHANSPRNRAGGPAVPQLNLGESQEQIKEKLQLQEKELAAFKAQQESMSSIVREQSAVRLSVTKAQFDAGLISARTFYEAERDAALDAAQQRYQSAAEYLQREKAMLETIASKRGMQSQEYQEELAKNQKAVQEVQTAQLAYAKTYLDSEEKMRQALKDRSDSYEKMSAQALEDAGRYVEAEKKKQEMDSRSVEYLRLKLDAAAGLAEAVSALQVVEDRRAASLESAQAKESSTARQYQTEIDKMKDKLEELNGKDKEIIKSESELRDGLSATAALRDKLGVAWAQHDRSAISALQQQINLQDQLNQRLQNSIQLEQRKGELAGSIVGYNGNAPIYADSYARQQAATSYVSNSQLLGQQKGATGSGSNSPFVTLNTPNPYALASYAVGTEYVPQTGLYELHRGEAVLTEKENILRQELRLYESRAAKNATPTSLEGISNTLKQLDSIKVQRGRYIAQRSPLDSGGVGGGYTGNSLTIAPGAIQLIIQGGGNVDVDSMVDSISRKLIPKLDEYTRRRRAA